MNENKLKHEQKAPKLLLSAFYFYPATSLVLVTLFLVADIPFGFSAIILAVLASCLMHKMLAKVCVTQDMAKSGLFWAATLLVTFIYSIYSPVMEMRQDPAVYAFRAFALVNTGTDSISSEVLNSLIETDTIQESEVKGYAKLANGIQWRDGAWTPDFYAGPSHLMASLGMFSKSITFFAATWTSLLCFLLLIKLFSSLCSRNISILIALAFMISPLMTWFGRANYSEPIALYCFLISGLFLKSFLDSRHTDMRSGLGLIIILASACFCRIDMFIVGLAATVAIGYRQWKLSLILAVSLMVVFFLCAEAYPIYHTRITRESTILANIHWIILLASIGSSVSGKLAKKPFDAVFNSRFTSVCLGLLLAIPTLLIFRDNLPFDVEMEMIHGKVRRTYNELNIERLFLFYPQILILLGSLGLWVYLRTKEVATEYKFFIIIAGVILGYYLIDISNSPQMYWAYRRYLYVLIPLFFLGFASALKFFANTQVSRALVAALLILTINLQINSYQIFRLRPPTSEMQGMDVSVKGIIKRNPELQPGTVLFHAPELRYKISSLISMASVIPIPLKNENDLQEILDSDFPVVYAGTSEKLSISSPAESVSKENLKYVRLGENYRRLPTELQKHNHEFFIHKF